MIAREWEKRQRAEGRDPRQNFTRDALDLLALVAVCAPRSAHAITPASLSFPVMDKVSSVQL